MSTAPPGLLRTPFTVVDGGLSTALEQAGHDLADPLWTARLLAEQPGAIVDAHLAYLRAGAEVLITASYQASVAGFVAAGHDPSAARALVASSTAVARDAVEMWLVDHGRSAERPLVAASVGPYGATLHDGSEYHGRYDASWDDVRAFHRERLAILAGSGPDLLAVETIPSAAEAEIVIDELTRHAHLPAWVSFSCAGSSTTNHGDDIGDAAALVAASDQVLAVGVNCTAPDHVAPLLTAIAARTELPLVAYPNHGRSWDAAAGCWVGPEGGIDPDAHLASWLAAGARLIGGCCGVGPAGIARLAAHR